jgi:1-phosphofructokinase family hexose kinase
MDSDIVTITLNPAVDQTVFLERLKVGSVNRTTRHHRQAGGKGVNVSALLGGYGVSSTATGFLGRDNHDYFSELFKASGVTDAFIRIAGETRTGIKIIDEATHETTDINFPGLEPTFPDLQRFENRLRKLVKPSRWFVIAGSLPKGISVHFFEEILALLKRGGAKVAVDTSGDALKAAIDGGADLIKPNEHELAEYLGEPLTDFASKVAAAVKIQREKVPHVILSLGSEGALFVTPDSALMAAAPPVKVVSTVGAGDSLLAGYLAGVATDRSPGDCARLATVFAWSTLENLTRQLPPLEEIQKRVPKIKVQSLAKMKF